MVHRRILRGRIIAPAVFLLSIPAAFILGSNTPFLWFLILPLTLISRHLSRPNAGRRRARTNCLKILDFAGMSP